jgi:hypothetical protein
VIASWWIPLGCGPEALPACEALEGVAADQCRAAGAEALFATDPDAAFAMALRIADGGLRDLAISAGVRATGRDFCDQIGADELRRACQTSANRPHLRYEGGKAGASAPAALSGVAADLASRCGERGSGLWDACVFQAALGSGDPAAARALCGAVGDEATRGDCFARLAEGAADPAEVCDLISGEKWRNECYFRASEALDGAPEGNRAAEAAALCAKAGFYADQCYTHLVDRAVVDEVDASHSGSFAEAVAGLERLEGALLPLVHHPSLPPGPLRQTFWLEALHALVTEAGSRGALDSWRGLGAVFPAEDVRRALFDDLWGVLWVRLRLQEQVRRGEDAGGLSRLQSFLDEPPKTSPQAPGSAPLVPPSLDATAKGYDTPTLASIRSQAPLAVRFPTGTAPWPLDPEAPCRLSADERRAVVALWALAPFPWELCEQAVRDGLAHGSDAVEAYAADLVGDKALVWLNRDPAPPWAVEALRRVHGRAAPRAQRVADALARGQPAGGSGAPWAGVCP